MLWPFHKRYHEEVVAYWKREAERRRAQATEYENIALRRTAELLAAHKGIRRLVARVKRLEKGPWKIPPVEKEVDG